MQDIIKQIKTNKLYAGPNELSIRDVDALPAILGTDGLPKGPSERFSTTTIVSVLTAIQYSVAWASD